jgi:calcineurin-like phosphoesterase family protein
MPYDNGTISCEDIYFTSDIHFFHENIIKFCSRPYKDVDAMTEAIVANWNNKVPKGATVYILGDLAMGGKRRADELLQILSNMNGYKILVPGNHDTYVLKDRRFDNYIYVESDYKEIFVAEKQQTQQIVMMHYPIASWNNMYKGSWMLHGHCHHNNNEGLNLRGAILDVGIDGKGYGHSPLSYSDVKVLIENKVKV